MFQCSGGLWARAPLTRCLCSLLSPPLQNTKHYELLNYSEHGTTVDNVLYSCDFSEKMTPTPPSSIVAKVQSVISECETRRTPGAVRGGQERVRIEPLSPMDRQRPLFPGSAWVSPALPRLVTRAGVNPAPGPWMANSASELGRGVSPRVSSPPGL